MFQSSRILYTCIMIPYASVNVSVYNMYTVCTDDAYKAYLHHNIFPEGFFIFLSTQVRICNVYCEKHEVRYIEGEYTDYYSTIYFW